MIRAITRTMGLALALAACKAPPPTLETGDTDDPLDTAEIRALTTWTYTDVLLDGTATVADAESVPFFELDGVLFGGDLLGPVLMADTGHTVRFSITNQGAGELDLDFDQVDVLENVLIDSGSTGTNRFSSGRDSQVTAWSDPTLRGSGVLGLVVVRDPNEFPVNDFDEHISLVLFSPDVTNARIDPCYAVGDAPCGITDPAPPDFDIMVAQRSVQTYFPPPDAPQRNAGRRGGGDVRHGGPPNEFVTSAPAVNRMLVSSGSDLRVHLYNATDTPATFDLGGLPVTIGESGPIELQPGEGKRLVSNGPAEGQYPVTCPGTDSEWACTVRIDVVP